MNKDQIVSLVTGILKVLGGVLLAHGATKAAAFINAEDVSGLIVSASLMAYTHFYNAPNTVGVTLQKVPLTDDHVSATIEAGKTN